MRRRRSSQPLTLTKVSLIRARPGVVRNVRFVRLAPRVRAAKFDSLLTGTFGAGERRSRPSFILLRARQRLRTRFFDLHKSSAALWHITCSKWAVLVKATNPCRRNFS